MRAAWHTWEHKQEGWKPRYCGDGSNDHLGCRALPVSCLIHCDRSSSSAPSDLTEVLRPPSLHHSPRWRLMPCIFHRWSKQQQSCNHNIQPQAIWMELTMMECLTLIHTGFYVQTHSYKSLMDSCITQCNTNKHALSVNGCMHPVTTAGARLLQVI